ncbi:MAG: hypothetical protein K0R71_1776 [Bacillales bacterium]|nr:hypothetical protein [Bacillales bacterium]
MISLILVVVIATPIISFAVKQVGKKNLAKSNVNLNASSISTEDTNRLSNPASSQIPSSVGQNPSPTGENPSPEGQNSSTEGQNSVSNTSNLTTSPVSPKECVHNYVNNVVAPTCKSKGYTRHTCSKCGKSYIDSYVAPRHDYGKYLCEYCGLPDPSIALSSLPAWLEKHGTLEGNGIYSGIHYTENGGKYSIYYNTVSFKDISFDYENNGEIFRILLVSTKLCSIAYYKNGINGSMSNINNSTVNSSMKLNLDHFEITGNTNVTKEECEAQMASKIDGFINIIQNKLLLPNTGLKLRDFGFTSY